MTSPTPAEALEAAAKIAEGWDKQFVAEENRLRVEVEDRKKTGRYGHDERRDLEMRLEIRGAQSTAAGRIAQDIRAYAASLPTTNGGEAAIMAATLKALAADTAVPPWIQTLAKGTLARAADATPTTAEALARATTLVLDTFKKDEAQGYRSRDRQFAIDVLGNALGEHRASAAGQDKP